MQTWSGHHLRYVRSQIYVVPHFCLCKLTNTHSTSLLAGEHAQNTAG